MKNILIDFFYFFRANGEKLIGNTIEELVDIYLENPQFRPLSGSEAVAGEVVSEQEIDNEAYEQSLKKIPDDSLLQLVYKEGYKRGVFSRLRVQSPASEEKGK